MHQNAIQKRIWSIMFYDGWWGLGGRRKNQESLPKKLKLEEDFEIWPREQIWQDSLARGKQHMLSVHLRDTEASVPMD